MSNAYGVSLNLTDAEARELWGAPESLDDVKALFQKFCSGDLKALPWSDTPVAKETSAIGSQLKKLNGRGFSTINSKPAVDGAPSDDKVHGWGTSNGYVYQKGQPRASSASSHPSAWTRSSRTSTATRRSPTTRRRLWRASDFLAWKDEAYELGRKWATVYGPSSPSRKLLQGLFDSWFLINVVHNDFKQPDAIFKTPEIAQIPDRPDPKLVRACPSPTVHEISSPRQIKYLSPAKCPRARRSHISHTLVLRATARLMNPDAPAQAPAQEGAAPGPAAAAPGPAAAAPGPAAGAPAQGAAAPGPAAGAPAQQQVVQANAAQDQQHPQDRQAPANQAPAAGPAADADRQPRRDGGENNQANDPDLNDPNLNDPVPNDVPEDMDPRAGPRA
ncbi:unnamed protein product [Tilletia controversa]|nr:unnamed protein product [Tilletia controversa]